jgi:hypothetical protein
MKLGMPIVVAIFSSLSMTPVAAGDGGEAAIGSASAGAAGVAAGKQIGEDPGVSVGGAEGGSWGAAVTTTEKGKTETVVDDGRKHGAAAGKAKRASTATAAGHVYDQVKKGNIQIQGATDADIYE